MSPTNGQTPLKNTDEGKGMQEPILSVLYRTLEAIGVDASIQTLADRKRVQKAIYLAQVSGLPLGYRFGWYILGPYSPSLTRDYFALADALSIGNEVPKSAVLEPSISSRLEPLRQLATTQPNGVNLDQADWLELVASIDYLAREWNLDLTQIRDKISREKSHLAPHFDAAVSALVESGLWTTRKIGA